MNRLDRLFSPRELGLLAGLVLFTLLALFGPALSFEAGLAFADGRDWHGVPNAMDVFSNLPFAVLGLWGLRAVLQGPPAPAGERGFNALAAFFFVGLLVTAACSSFYHLHPDMVRLASDRAGMTVAFAGLIGLPVAERIGRRAGAPAAAFLLATGLVAAFIHCATRNVLPWALVQFGGMALVVLLAFMRPVDGVAQLRLGWVIAFYALAKVFELGEGWFYEATGHLVSGHSLKHVIAALAALPVIAAVKALRHNSHAALNERAVTPSRRNH